MDSKYRQLANFLAKEIDDGIYSEGSFLPGERVLCEQFCLSRGTVRNGLNLLVKENRIKAVTGQGYQVLGTRPFAFRKASHLIGGLFAATPLLQYNNLYVSTPFQLILGINRVLEDSGYCLTFANSKDNLDSERECIENLLKCGVDGLLIQPAYTGGAFGRHPHDSGNYEYFRKLYRDGLPIVLMDRPLVGQGLPGIFNDDVAGGRMQAEYFLARGFRKVLYFEEIGGLNDHLRYAGYEAAMREAGLEPQIIDMPGEILEIPWDIYTPHLDEIASVLPQYITEDTGIITNFKMVRSLEKLFPEGRCGKFRVEWCCYDLPNMGAKPYPCAIRPLDKIGERACRKMMNILNHGHDTGNTEMLAPKIEIIK